MKFVKGVAVFLVCCLAAYGAFTLFKKSPKLDIPESDVYGLRELGVDVRDTRAGASGLSPILSDVEGVAPISATTGTSFGGGSSTPPDFLAGPSASSTPPPFMMQPAPRVVTANTEPPSALEFSPPVMEVLPPPAFAEPVYSPIQKPSVTVPPVNTTAPEASYLGTPSLEVLLSPPDAPPIPATESPPPSTESWDGPASNIPEIPPRSEFLQSLTPPQILAPNPLASSPVGVLSSVYEQTALKFVEENTRATKESVRRQEPDMPFIPAQAVTPVGQSSDEQDITFSSSNSVPLDTAAISSTRYTQTSSRQPLTFEPVKPEISPTAPVVAFVRPSLPLPSDQIQQAQQPATVHPVAVSPAAVKPTVTPIGTPRHIENLPPLRTAPPTNRETTIGQFIQSQRQLAESGDPENIRQAFILLSRLYELDRLDDSERTAMQPILDVLALKVIYAKGAHILEPPYRVNPGETIESIAKDFNLTPAFLRKVNGLGTSQEVPAGTMLKVVVGQFDARISLQRRELTLLLGGLYAGRFSFSLPNEGLQARKGDCYVTHRADRAVMLNNGWVLATNLARNATIVFTDQDARDISDILSEQSVIVME